MRRTWTSEHGEDYAVPPLLFKIPGIEDMSWHNDMCPCLGHEPFDTGRYLRIWIEHPIAEQRECPMERFMVCLYDGNDQHIKNHETGDVHEAIRVYTAWLEEERQVPA